MALAKNWLLCISALLLVYGVVVIYNPKMFVDFFHNRYVASPSADVASAWWGSAMLQLSGLICFGAVELNGPMQKKFLRYAVVNSIIGTAVAYLKDYPFSGTLAPTLHNAVIGVISLVVALVASSDNGKPQGKNK